jgi:outer membrane protein assembly factor BamD
MSMFARFLAVLLVLATWGCGGSVRDKASYRGSGSSGGNLEYSVSAAENYEAGMTKLKDEDWVDAIRFFNFVKARFPYSKYAVLSDLRLADAAYGADSYLEAIDQYRLFMKLHPTHEMVENGYASFRIGESFYQLLPDDWFLLPPSREKDMTSSLEAARELSMFLKRYPRSEYAPKAKELYRKVAHLLASHEWYVAQFYWDRDLPMGTVLRLRTLLDKYPDAGFDEAALWLLGRAYMRVSRPDDARKTFQQLVEKFPKSAHAEDARREVEKIAKAPPPKQG